VWLTSQRHLLGRDACRATLNRWVNAGAPSLALPGLRVLALIYNSVECGDFTRASELRLWLDTYGITAKCQQDRRWLAPDAKPPCAPSTRADDARLSVRERFGR
jgi:hypothetical protein